MDQRIPWAAGHMPKTDDKNLPIIGLEEIAKVRIFHKSFPQYARTPPTELDRMIAYLGVKEIYLKDEFYRSGLNALKILSGSFSIARYITKETSRDVFELPYSILTSDQLREEFGQATFLTAIDDNHGCSVAWTANRLGQKAVAHMPKDSTQTRLENTAKEGVQVDIQGMNYDGCVRLAAEGADEMPRGVMVQDTAWDGYKKIPPWIMQGCGTVAMEAGEQLREYGCERLTHILVQVGVGSLADAAIGYLSSLYADSPPVLIVVGAEVAAYLYKGAAAGDGQIRTVNGDMETTMAGFTCGEPNIISWDILKNHMKALITVPNCVATNGMRMLGVPTKGDVFVTSGESGAALFGTLAAIMSMDEYANLRKDTGLDGDSRILLFSTEGDTDPDRYKNTAWKGLDK